MHLHDPYRRNLGQPPYLTLFDVRRYETPVFFWILVGFQIALALFMLALGILGFIGVL